MKDAAYEILESLNSYNRKVVLGNEELKTFLCINASTSQEFTVEQDYECRFIPDMSGYKARKLGLRISSNNRYIIPRGTKIVLKRKYRDAYVFSIKGFDITISDFRYLYLSSNDNMLSTATFVSEEEADEFIEDNNLEFYEKSYDGEYYVVKYHEIQSIERKTDILKKKTQKSYTWKKLVKENLIGYYWIVSYSVDNNAKEGYVYYVNEIDARKSKEQQIKKGIPNKRVIKVYFDGKGIK